MLNKVIMALEGECQKNSNSEMFEVICQHLVEKCEANSQTAEIMAKAIDNKKNIAGAIAKMKACAKKRAVGGVGVISDSEGFKIVDQYFGIKEEKASGDKIVSLTAFM